VQSGVASVAMPVLVDTFLPSCCSSAVSGLTVETVGTESGPGALVPSLQHPPQHQGGSRLVV